MIKNNYTTVIIETDTIFALDAAFHSKIHYLTNKKFSGLNMFSPAYPQI